MIASARLNYNNGYRLPLPQPSPKVKVYKEHSQFVYSLIYHRNTILLVSFLAIVMLSVFFSAYCKTWADFGGGKNDPKVGGLLGFLVDHDGWIDQIIGSNKVDKYAKILEISASGNNITSIGGMSNLGGLSTALHSVNSLFQLVGWGLALIFWGYSFTEMLMESNGQLIVEQMIKKLLFLVVTFHVIKNSLTFCCEIVNAGTELTNSALGGLKTVPVKGVNDFKEYVFNNCWTESKAEGFFDFSGILTTLKAVGFIITLFIPWIVTVICDILVKVLCWSRAIEICVFAAISPIMFIDLGTTRDLTHSSTARALKNLMSLAMQGALIVISLTICQSIMEGILNDSSLEFMDKIWNVTLISILQVGTISKTQSVAKQALGV